MNKILITGSTGMVGRNIVEYKEAQFYEILAPKREELNLLDKTQVLAYLKRHKPNIIVHCAGLVGGISANIANPVEFLSQNVSMGLNIIMAALECGVEKFLNIASSCMYPKEGKNPLSEDLILNGGLEPTNEGYALAKIVSTKLCEYILDSKNKLYKTAIPCNLYGKYDKFEINKAHMLPAVIAKIHSAKKSGAKEVEIWGSGKARREFMYVEDLADFVYYALKNFERMPKVLNVGRGEDFSITEYYEAIAEVIGYKGDFVYNTQKPEGMAQKLVDITHLKEFGWSSNTSLKEGIEKTYKYFLKGVTMQYYSLASSTWDYKELQAIEEVIKSDIFTMGTRVAEFEKNFAAYVGAKYAVMTSSGSTANLIATAALFYTSKHKLQRGDGDCFLTPERHTSLSRGGGQAGQGYPCILTGSLTPWDNQQRRISTPLGVSPTINSGEQKPGGLLFTAGFCAGAAPTAGGIGYQEECAPTLKAAESGTNMVPSILCLTDHGGQRTDLTADMTPTLRAQMGSHQPLICLNDQGGSVMECSVDVSGTLRAQEHGHQPLIIGAQEDGEKIPAVQVYENHGIDSRYTGPHPVSPTLSARAGTGFSAPHIHDIDLHDL